MAHGFSVRLHQGYKLCAFNVTLSYFMAVKWNVKDEITGPIVLNIATVTSCFKVFIGPILLETGSLLLRLI
jgi:hypothetical protein